MNSLDIKQYLKVSLLSLITASFAYLLVFFVGNFASLYFAYDFDIGASFTISGLLFEVKRSNPLWTYDAEVTIFLSRPLLSFVVGIISLGILILKERMNLIFFLFLLWLNIFAFNAALGLFVDDFISKAGLFFVAERMELSVSAMIFSMAVTVYLMYRLGFVNCQLFLRKLPDKSIINYKSRLIIVAITVFVPWLLSGIILLLLSFPGHDIYEHLNTISTLIILLPFFMIRKNECHQSEGSLLLIKNYEWIIVFVMFVGSMLLYLRMLNPVFITI
jgi:hypothetical protein